MRSVNPIVIVSTIWLTMVSGQSQTKSFPKPPGLPSATISELGPPLPTAGDLGLSKIATSLKRLSFTIDRHPGWAGDEYEEGQPIRIRCTFKNTGRRTLTFRLADHDSYHGTQPYPFGLRVRVSNLAGVVISATPEFGEWWTHYYRSSGVYPEMPGDRIRLQPGQQVIRIVPLDEILVGNRVLGRLVAGEYLVEMEIEGIVSNKMKIKIGDKR